MSARIAHRPIQHRRAALGRVAAPHWTQFAGELGAAFYDYDALQPMIDAETMQLHLAKHHGAYVDTLTKVLEPYARRWAAFPLAAPGSPTVTPAVLRPAPVLP